MNRMKHAAVAAVALCALGLGACSTNDEPEAARRAVTPYRIITVMIYAPRRVLLRS